MVHTRCATYQGIYLLILPLISFSSQTAPRPSPLQRQLLCPAVRSPLISPLSPQGEVENELIHLTAQPQSATESYIIKPWMVLKKEGGTMAQGLAMLSRVGLSYTIWVNELAAVMINIALKGSKVQTMENDALGFEGKKLLKGSERK